MSVVTVDLLPGELLRLREGERLIRVDPAVFSRQDIHGFWPYPASLFVYRANMAVTTERLLFLAPRSRWYDRQPIRSCLTLLAGGIYLPPLKAGLSFELRDVEIFRYAGFPSLQLGKSKWHFYLTKDDGWRVRWPAQPAREQHFQAVDDAWRAARATSVSD